MRGISGADRWICVVLQRTLQPFYMLLGHWTCFEFPDFLSISFGCLESGSISICGWQMEAASMNAVSLVDEPAQPVLGPLALKVILERY